MKLIYKYQILKIYSSKYEVNYKQFLKEVTFEKEVGLLGNECRFLVKLINTFQTEVKKNYLHKIVFEKRFLIRQII